MTKQQTQHVKESRCATLRAHPKVGNTVNTLKSRREKKLRGPVQEQQAGFTGAPETETLKKRGGGIEA